MAKSNEQPTVEQTVEQTAAEQAAKEAEATAKDTEAKAVEEQVAKESEVKTAAKPAAKKATEEDALHKEANAIFKDYPDEQVVYMTADGFGFFNEHEAHLHTARLSDKDVVTVKRK